MSKLGRDAVVKPSRDLRHLLLAYLDDASHGDAAYRDIVSLAPEAIAIGSDAGEIWVGGEWIRAVGRAQAMALGRFSYSMDFLEAYEVGDFGWAVCSCTITNRAEISRINRVTMVFRREGGEWRAIHFHTSVAVDNLTVDGAEISTIFDRLVQLVADDHPHLVAAAAPNGTVTVVFTDIEGSTEANERLGDAGFVPLLQAHNETVRDTVRSFGGTVLKSLGDGFMIVFSSPHSALDCAVTVQRELVTRFVDQAALRIRIGAHTGEPVRDGKDFFGRDVAYAARVAANASGGEILVSAVTKAATEGGPNPFAFDGPREVELKGFDGLQPLFSVRW